jgi:hypothetical protein
LCASPRPHVDSAPPIHTIHRAGDHHTAVTDSPSVSSVDPIASRWSRPVRRRRTKSPAPHSVRPTLNSTLQNQEDTMHDITDIACTNGVIYVIDALLMRK